MNILLTCAGRRNYLVHYFKDAVNDEGRVFACDSSDTAPALAQADRSFIVPSMDHPDYFEELLSICRAERVRLLVSVNDLELGGLARLAARFRAVGTIAVVSSPHVIALCQDKWAAHHWLRTNGIATPATYLSLVDARAALARQEIHFPLLIKPRWGTSSIGVEQVADDRELALACEWVPIQLRRTILARMSRAEPERAVVIQEFLEGQEYGMDVVNDLDGRHAGTLVRRKLVMRAGNTDRAITVAEPRLERLGERLGQALGHIGSLDCDVMSTERGTFVLDLNPRLGGGYPFSHLAGANLPAALMAWANGAEADPSWLRAEAGVVSSKYDGVAICEQSVCLS